MLDADLKWMLHAIQARDMLTDVTTKTFWKDFVLKKPEEIKEKMKDADWEAATTDKKLEEMQAPIDEVNKQIAVIESMTIARQAKAT